MSAPSTPLERWFPVVGIARSYTRDQARGDLIAALTVALFTIPQGMAYALIAGMPPASGIWAAVAASVLGAAFGSSEFLVNGPTNALSVLLAANTSLFVLLGDPVLAIISLTFLAGVIQCGASTLRLGGFTRFVSEPVLTGFTAGAGLYIAVNQIPAVLGLDRASTVETIAGWKPPAACLFDFVRIVLSLGHTNLVALATGGATFALVRGLQAFEQRIDRRLPAPFLAVAFVSAFAFALGLGDPALGAQKLRLVRDIEPVRRALPTLVWPDLRLADLRQLVGPAFAVAALGAVEAIAIGKSLASRVGHSFDANRQLAGEGLCNLGAAFVGGFASSGSFTRSAVNFQAGAVTRLSCIWSGALVLVIVLLFAPAANYIPVCVLAGTLIHVGLKLVNVGQLRLTMQTTIADRTVLLVTFAGVLVVEHLQVALFIGVAVSLLLALRRAEGFKLMLVEEMPDGRLVEQPFEPDARRPVLAIVLQGELFFAAAEVLERRLREVIGNGTRYIVLRLTHAYNLDATCAEVLGQVAREARARGGRLVLSGVRPGLFGTLERAGVLREIGHDAVFRHEEELLASTRKAIAWARGCAARGG